ncbi:uncharacterized protein A1O5_09391 [Cladophialophora psammophila CBS 110553]|uniref:NAD(P)-binding protein n=1 Tax=Cladophialophora psammophila CBS 110553 TaxID=1182543 RepID=W9WHL2_9EURO|nr:uncharacterized protein A1O5_09391 [Cladophialophora psammophila CBS 110553]EXJ67378.1 hypothetical protein A1O5_09391 [Cladophialophora psammophila CBS 110553]
MSDIADDYYLKESAYTRTLYREPYPSIDPTSPALSQAGRVVVITGASSGIGQRGWAAIILVALDLDGLQEIEKALKQITTDVEYILQPTDITSPNAVDALFEVIKTKYGHADVLINNAGTFGPTDRIADSDPSLWWRDFEINVKGTYLVSRAFLKLLGANRSGSIITVSSGFAVYVDGGASSYSVSKLTSLRFSEYLAAEYPNVNCVTIQPGIMDTTIAIDHHKPFALDSPELVGSTGVWLATDAAAWLSGRFISANWSVDELIARKEAILAGDDLTIRYQGKFGYEQFE